MAMQLDKIQLNLLEQVADLHDVPQGAYSLRINGNLYGKNDSENITIVAKTDKAHKILSEQLKDKTLNREYKALIKGRIKEDFEVEGYLGRNPKNREQMAMVQEKNGKYSKNEGIYYYEYKEVPCLIFLAIFFMWITS